MKQILAVVTRGVQSVLLVSVAAVCGLARSQAIDSDDRITNRMVEPLQAPTVQPEAVGTVSKPNPQFTLILGLNDAQRDAGGRAISTPFEFDYTPNGQRWSLVVTGGGWENSSLPGAPATNGFNDTLVLANYNLPNLGTASVAATAGYNFPAHGDEGSTTASELARLYVTVPVVDAKWVAAMTLTALHADSCNPGTSCFTGIVKGAVKYLFSDMKGHILAMTLQRSSNGVAGGVTKLGMQLQQPLSVAWALALGVTRGLTTNARFTQVEVDLSKSF